MRYNVSICGRAGTDLDAEIKRSNEQASSRFRVEFVKVSSLEIARRPSQQTSRAYFAI